MDKSTHGYDKWSPKWEGPFRVKDVFSENSYAMLILVNPLRAVIGKIFKTIQTYYLRKKNKLRQIR